MEGHLKYTRLSLLQIGPATAKQRFRYPTVYLVFDMHKSCLTLLRAYCLHIKLWQSINHRIELAKPLFFWQLAAYQHSLATRAWPSSSQFCLLALTQSFLWNLTQLGYLSIYWLGRTWGLLTRFSEAEQQLSFHTELFTNGSQSTSQSWQPISTAMKPRP